MPSYFPALPIQFDPRRRLIGPFYHKGKLPLLAVCYGAQYLAHFSGGAVKPSNTREYGRANLSLFSPGKPFLKELIKAAKSG